MKIKDQVQKFGSSEEKNVLSFIPPSCILSFTKRKDRMRFLLRRELRSDKVADEALWICVRLERINEVDSILCLPRIIRKNSENFALHL
ncbi:hypothetical protein CEQ15_08505 [Chryseobacterium indologenes]|nr:hypothetical protein CEQ15_08505 [Chryseobacterium indologenes]